MKIDKVTYQKTYSIGPYLTDRVGFEATVDEYENISDALDGLKKEADDWHQEANPHLYQEIKDGTLPMPLQPGTIHIITKDKEKVEIAIDNCTTLEELSGCKAAATHHGLVNEYMNKIKELTTGRPDNFTEGLA